MFLFSLPAPGRVSRSTTTISWPCSTCSTSSCHHLSSASLKRTFPSMLLRATQRQLSIRAAHSQYCFFFLYIYIFFFFYSFTRRLSMESTLTSARLQHGSRVPFTNASSSTLPFSSRLARSLRKWISGTLICYAARILTRAFI